MSDTESAGERVLLGAYVREVSEFHYTTVTEAAANTDDLSRFDVKSSPYWRSLGFRHIVYDLGGLIFVFLPPVFLFKRLAFIALLVSVLVPVLCLTDRSDLS